MPSSNGEPVSGAGTDHTRDQINCGGRRGGGGGGEGAGMRGGGGESVRTGNATFSIFASR